MTEVDVKAALETESVGTYIRARIPLAGHVTLDWIVRYQSVAERALVPARAEDGPDRSWLTVAVLPGENRAEVLRSMDRARALIPMADALDLAPQAAQTMAFAQEWWSSQQGS